MSINEVRAARPNPRPFAELFNEPKDFNRVFERLEHTIYWSFAYIDANLTGRAPVITKSETARRFKICEKWFRILRGEMGFGLIRTLDTIPRALACELLEIEFDPHGENLAQGWTARPTTIQHIIQGAKGLKQ